MSINRVCISGNLTRDPELRSTAGGTSVLGFGVAVNDRRKNQQSGEWEDYPNFVDCTLFGARAEAVSKYIAKGSRVAIEGKLRWSQWERDGQKRSKLEVIVDEIVLMAQQRPQEGGYAANAYVPQQSQPQPTAAPQVAQGGYQPQQYQSQAYHPQPAQQAAPAYDSDIPF